MIGLPPKLTFFPYNNAFLLCLFVHCLFTKRIWWLSQIHYCHEYEFQSANSGKTRNIKFLCFLYITLNFNPSLLLWGRWTLFSPGVLPLVSSTSLCSPNPQTQRDSGTSLTFLGNSSSFHVSLRSPSSPCRHLAHPP